MIDNFRLQNLLSQFNQPSPNMPSTGIIDQSLDNDLNDPMNEQDMMARLAALFHPSYEAQNQLRDSISAMPQRADYKLSRGQDWMARIAGLGTARPSTYYGGSALGFDANIPEGLAVTESLRNRNYDKAVGDWKNKLEPITDLARSEQSRNINERTIANDVMGRSIALGQLRRQENRDAATRKINETKAETAKKRAEAYIWKTMHPAHKSYVNSDGFVVFFDPTRPNEPPIVTDVDTKDMTEIEKMNYQIEGRIEAIRAKGEEDRKTAADTLPGKKDLKTTIPGKNTAPTQIAPKPPLPNRTEILTDDKGKVLSKKETTYGNSDTVQMRHPTSGAVGAVKKSDVEAAKKAGYTEVK